VDIDALVWLLFPFLVMVVVVVLIKVRPSASKPSKKSIATGIVVAAIIYQFTFP